LSPADKGVALAPIVALVIASDGMTPPQHSSSSIARWS
jgi:hypothetical protein